MKSKSIILIAVSLGFGLVAAIGISQVMGRNANVPPPKKEETKPVMVSMDDIDIKAELTEEKVTIERWPASLVPPDAISSLEEVKDKLLNCRVAKKMPILKQMVVSRNEFTDLAIPKGYKVVAIKLPPDDVFSGLLNPGDVVDLIGVFTNDKTKVSRTFLTSVRVFSVNNKTTPDMDRGKQASTGAVVGLLLTKNQAEKLILAQKVAQIKLVMRSDDSDPNAKLAATKDSDSPDGFSQDDFSDSEEQPDKPAAEDGFLTKLLSGKTESDIVHKMVMVTPEGPVSYVFHKDVPLPQRIEGYLTPAPVKNEGSSDTDESSADDDLVETNDSAISNDSSLNNDNSADVEDSGSAEESNPASDE